MGPRKRIKTNPSETPPSEIPLPDASETAQPVESPDAVEIGASDAAELEKADSNSAPWTRSWYGGTWPQVAKAAPVTQVARESISAASSAASGLVSSARSRRTPSGPVRSPSLYLSRSMGSSTRSLPVAATTTKLNITSNATIRSQDSSENGQSLSCERTDTTGGRDQVSGNGQGAETGDEVVNEEQKKQDVGTDTQTCPPNTDLIVLDQQRPINESSTWLGWFSKSTTSSGGDGATQPPGSAKDSSHLPFETPSTRLLAQEDPTPVAQAHERQQSNSDTLLRSRSANTIPRPNSWFNLWNKAAVAPPAAVGEDHPATAPESLKLPTPLPVPNVERDPEQIKPPAEGSTIETQTLPTSSKAAARGVGWAFWSRDNTQQGNGLQASRAETGELAVPDTPSQNSPKSATAEKVTSLGKRGRAPPLEGTDGAASSPEPGPVKNLASASAASKTRLTELVASKQLQSVLPNLVLPLFESTYGPQESSNLLQQLGKLLRYSKSSNPQHLQIIRDPPRIQKALAIGVHGYFPAPLIRTVLGQPTGTSVRFATSAASAIREWTTKQGYSCEIEKIALEGEGKISERVELLWKLLLNWLDVIRKADFILIACHSQGVPVTIMLVARLIALGCVESGRIGICAMAGINLGPFADFKSRWIGGSAGELFDFANPSSSVSTDYLTALETALRYGVRVVYIGSIDDQLVSLESSTFGNISHPYIYRAVFVDGRVHAPDFITHLVGFALKLRNLGISDHGLIKELSSPLAGSLYGGEGHSRIYDDESVYHLAAMHALETTSIGDVPLQSRKPGGASAPNPYILPFAMRGLLEEDYVRTQLHDEIQELLRQFDNWKPSSKVLKDVKFRLEGVRSKL